MLHSRGRRPTRPALGCQTQRSDLSPSVDIWRPRPLPRLCDDATKYSDRNPKSRFLSHPPKLARPLAAAPSYVVATPSYVVAASDLPGFPDLDSELDVYYATLFL
jgi:hypothetical protein